MELLSENKRIKAWIYKKIPQVNDKDAVTERLDFHSQGHVSFTNFPHLRLPAAQ